MSKKAQKNGRNHKKTGKKRAILPKRPFKTGMPVLKRATSSHCNITRAEATVRPAQLATATPATDESTEVAVRHHPSDCKPNLPLYGQAGPINKNSKHF